MHTLALIALSSFDIPCVNVPLWRETFKGLGLTETTFAINFNDFNLIFVDVYTHDHYVLYTIYVKQ